MKINIRSLSSNPIIILNNKGIDKLSPPSFYINMVIENEGIKNIEDKGNLKNLQLSYSESPLFFVNKNVLDDSLFKSSISPRIERLVKRRKKAIPEYGWKAKKGRTFAAPHIIRELL